MSENIIIGTEYAVNDGGTSDGTQIKYYKDSKWYKIDRYGGEGEAEELASKILELSGYPSDKFVKYSQIMINGSNGCVSCDFLKKEEQFINLYRLYMNVKGRDLASAAARMDYDDAIEFVLQFVRETTKVDLREYLADIFVLDEIILNEDRHFNNLGLIFDGDDFRPAPIFDNGKSFFIGNPNYDPGRSFADNKRNAFAKGFSGSFQLNRRYLQKYATFRPDQKAIDDYLKENSLRYSSRLIEVLRSTLSTVEL